MCYIAFFSLKWILIGYVHVLFYSWAKYVLYTSTAVSCEGACLEYVLLYNLQLVRLLCPVVLIYPGTVVFGWNVERYRFIGLIQ